MTAEDFITEKYEANNWGFYPPSRRLVAEWLEEYAERYHTEQCNIANVVGRSEQLKAVQKLKDFAYEVCPLHREDDLEEIVGSLDFSDVKS